MLPGVASLGVLAIIFSALQLFWIGLILRNGRESENIRKVYNDSKFQRNDQDNQIKEDFSITLKKKKLEELFKR